MCDFWVFNIVHLKRTYNPLILYYLQISKEYERLDGANANLFTCKITVCLLTPNGPQWHPYKLRWAIKWCRCQFVRIFTQMNHNYTILRVYSGPSLQVFCNCWVYKNMEHRPNDIEVEKNVTKDFGMHTPVWFRIS